MLQLQRVLQCLLSSSVTTASASAVVLSLQLEQLMPRSIADLLQSLLSSGLLLLQHLLQCFPSLAGSSSSYLCRWKSSCLDLSLTSSAATAIADTQYCFSSSICFSACRPLVLLLLLLLQHLLQCLLTLPSRDNASLPGINLTRPSQASLGLSMSI